MKLYLVTSTVDGMEAVPYPTLKDAVEAWLEGMCDCPQATSLKQLYDMEGPEAVLEMVKEMDYEDTAYLWNDGEERVDVVDIEWAVDRDQLDELEEKLEDAWEKIPTPAGRELLDAIEDGYQGHANRLLNCLAPALSHASEHYGYTSPEYKAVDAITSYIANQ